MLSQVASSGRLRHRAFVFAGASVAGRSLALRYQLTGGPDPDLAFEERLELPKAIAEPDPGDPVVARLIDGIHRVFGVSYFKAAVPQTIVAEGVHEQDARFWDALYTEGLGELYYRNELAPIELPAFPRTQAPARPVPIATVVTEAQSPERVLVLVGGGKDSVVAREVVRHAGVQADGFSLASAPWIARSAAAMQLRHLVAGRQLDPQLAELNRRGAYNGHVPISACIAFVAELVAYLGKYDAIIAANERTADEGNLDWNGLSINHQWSKSLGFERGFQAWCERQISSAPRYFSLLRPLTELRIAGAFATHPQYFDSFASCNANFRQHMTDEPQRWCGHCPKCVFVQLMLAPHLADAELERIFGASFLEDASNLGLIEQLTGISGFKPFECVGSAEESQAALARLAETGRLRGALAAWYSEKLAKSVEASALWQRAQSPQGPHCIPPIWEQRLHAYLRAHGA